MKPNRPSEPLNFLLCAGVAALAIAARPAQAQVVEPPPAPACLAIPIAPAPGDDIFGLEGPIQSFDRALRTITVNGVTFHLPDGLLVATDSPDGAGNLTFEALTDPALEAVRSIVGGTVIAVGNDVIQAGPAGELCLSLEATSVYVELGEHVIAGVLDAVDAAAGTFSVNGQLVSMNTDPRFPSALLSLGGGAIAVADLQGFEGSFVSAQGYFDSAADVLLGTLVETAVLLGPPGADAIAITRAESRADQNELRVRGQVGPTEAGQTAATVTIFTDGANAEGTACLGTAIGTVAVDPATLTFELRQRGGLASLPTLVCAASPLGSASAREVIAN